MATASDRTLQPTQPVPAQAEEDADHLFPVTIDDKACYINRQGEVIIKTEFFDGYDFYDDRAIVWRFEEDHAFAFAIIDKSGKVISKFTPAEPYDHTYSEGLISFDTEKGVGFMDLNGNVVVPPKYHFPPFEETGADCYCVFEGGPVDGFHEGLALVHEGHNVYFIDRTGKKAFDLKIDGGYAFNGGYAPIWIGENWGLVNTKGNLVAPARYAHVGAFADGLAPATEDGETYFYINARGEKVLDNGYGYAYEFSEGLAAVKLKLESSRYSYVDTAGKVVFTLPEHASPGSFKEGLVKVGLSTPVEEHPAPNHTLSYSIDQIVFYDRAGRQVIKLDPGNISRNQFGHFADDFSHGLAKVWSQDKGRRDGYIDKKGRWVWWTTD